MTSAHTPGPWEANGQSEQGRYITVRGADRRTVARVMFSPADGPYHDDANARLIAAAPEMLAALQAINAALTQPVQFSGSDAPGTCNILRGDCQVAGSIARAAIAKATGE